MQITQQVSMHIKFHRTLPKKTGHSLLKLEY